MRVDRRYLNVRVTIDGVVNAPTGEEANGAQYLVSATPTAGSAFEGHASQIAYKDNGAWKFFENFIGQSEVIDLSNGTVYSYTTAGWVGTDLQSDNIERIVDKRFLDPVDAVAVKVVQTAAELPATATINDVVLVLGENKVYTATDTDTFDSGTAAVNGKRYGWADGTKGYEYDVVDGVIVATELNDGVAFINRADEDLYTFNATNGELVNVTDIGARPEYRRHTIHVVHALTSAEITAHKFDLAKLAILAEGASLTVGGVGQTFGDDFTLTNDNGVTTVGWESLGMAQLDLQEGDKVSISYDTTAM